MNSNPNPFTPAFGTNPHVLAGRDHLLDDMRDAFIASVGNPNLSTLLIGDHGTGKTALMSRIRSVAMEEGWPAVSTTALPSMLEDVYGQSGHREHVGLKAVLVHVYIGPEGLCQRGFLRQERYLPVPSDSRLAKEARTADAGGVLFVPDGTVNKDNHPRLVNVLAVRDSFEPAVAGVKIRTRLADLRCHA